MAFQKEITIAVKETGLDAVNKKVNKLEQSVENLEAEQRSLARSLGESSNAVLENGGAMGLLNDATGGLAMTVKDAVEASWLFTKSQKAQAIQQSIATTVVGASTGAMKAFRIALAATGVGAIVIALVMLIANFDKVKKAVLNLIPGLASIGEFIGGLVEGFTDFIGVTSESERAMARLTEQADKSLALNKKFLAEEGDQINKYTKAKIEAKNAYNEAIKEEGANQVALAKRLNRELLAIDKQHEEDLAKARQERAEKATEEQRKAQEEAERKAKEAYDRKLERIKKEGQALFDRDQQVMQSMADVEAFRQEREKASEEEFDKESELSAFKFSLIDAELKAAEEARLQKIADEELVRDAKFQIANSVFDLVNMFAKKGSKLAKGVAAAQATMNTYQGITAALAAPSTIPEPFGQAVRIANSVSIGAMGLLNVKKILSTNESGASGGGNSDMRGSAPQAPSFNLVQGTGQNQIAESISKQAPVKAFVVSKDVTNGQELDRNLLNNASL